MRALKKLSQTNFPSATGFYLSMIFILGAALRLFCLGTRSIWFDEACSIAMAQYDFFSADGIVYKPLYFLLLKGWIHIFGIDPFWLRLPSVLFGVGAILVIYFLGKELINKKTGLIASFFLAISCFHIYHSQQVRHFTLIVLLVTFSFLCLIRMLNGNMQKLNYILYLGVNILIIFVHPYALAVIFVQFVIFYALAGKESRKLWLRAQIILLGTICLWALTANKFAMFHSAWWISRPNFSSVIENFQTFIYGGERYGLDDYKIVFNMPWALYALAVVYAIFFIKGILVCINRKTSSRQLLSVLLWLFLPLGSAFLLSMVFPVYAVKHLIISLPAFYLVVAAGIASLKSSRMAVIFLLFIFVGNSYPLKNIYAQDLNTQWKDAVAYLKQNINKNDAILISAESELVAFLYFFDPTEKALQHYDIGRYCLTENKQCLDSFYKQSNLIAGVPQNQGPGFTDALKEKIKKRLAVLENSQAKTVWLLASRWTGKNVEDYLTEYLSQRYALVKLNKVLGINIYKFGVQKP